MRRAESARGGGDCRWASATTSLNAVDGVTRSAWRPVPLIAGALPFLLLLITGCGAAVPCPATSSCGTITASDSLPQLVGVLRPALEMHGFVCSVTESQDLICKHDTLFNMSFSYKTATYRIVYSATFELKDAASCQSDLLAKINSANWNYNVWKASCGENLITFEGTLLVPKGGFTHDELFAYLKWWSSTLSQFSREAGILEYMK